MQAAMAMMKTKFCHLFSTRRSRLIAPPLFLWDSKDSRLRASSNSAIAYATRW